MIDRQHKSEAAKLAVTGSQPRAMTVTGSRPADYKALRQKLLFLIALITGGALLALAILAVLADNRLGNYIVRVLQMLGLEYDRAYRVFRLISASQDILMLVVLAIFILVFSSFLLRRFVRYFIEISDSLDILVEDRAGEIKLSAEMAAMEAKLNSIKQTLERREREAKEAEQRKNDVVMYIAHDIKTPLTSVIGYLSLLDEVPDMPIEQKARYVSISLEKAYQLEQLIEEFFEITRYNLQGIELDKQRIDLYYMLVQLVDEHYPQLSQQGMQAKVTAPEDITVQADPDRLARVFNNIMRNAIAYSTGSVVWIDARLTGGGVSISFSNAGLIPADKLTSIFDKFYRIDSARSSSGGAGLGLAIAKEIIDLHGGQIEVRSEDGQTTFKIELPDT